MEEELFKKFVFELREIDINNIDSFFEKYPDFDVNISNDSGGRWSLLLTILDEVINEKELEIAQILVDKGANVNSMLIQDFIISEFYNFVDFYTHNSKEIPYPEPIVTKFLIDNGIDVNTLDQEGNTPFDLALKYSHVRLFNKLKSLGAKVSDINKIKLQKYLSLESDDWLSEYRGWVILLPQNIESEVTIIKRPYPEFLISDYLIDNGIYINTLDQDGNTPLDLAIQAYHRKAIEKLRPLGAKVSDINKVKLQTYLLWEALLYLNEVLDDNELEGINYRLETITKINSLSTRIFKLCEKNKTILESNKDINTFMSDYLIEIGIDINNFEGNETPLDVAIKCYHTKAIEKLKSLGAKTYNELK